MQTETSAEKSTENLNESQAFKLNFDEPVVVEPKKAKKFDDLFDERPKKRGRPSGSTKPEYLKGVKNSDKYLGAANTIQSVKRAAYAQFGITYADQVHGQQVILTSEYFKAKNVTISPLAALLAAEASILLTNKLVVSKSQSFFSRLKNKIKAYLYNKKSKKITKNAHANSRPDNERQNDSRPSDSQNYL